MNRNVWLLCLLFGCAANARAASVVNVREQWNAHVSSTTGTQKLTSPAVSSAPVISDDPACDCDKMTQKEKLDQATYAFTGMVVDSRKPKKGRRVVTFDVDEMFKGSPKPETKVEIEDSNDGCDYPFTPGQSYLVFSRWEWGSNLTSRCMGTKFLAKVQRDALGPSEQMKEKLYIRLRNACMGRRDTGCCLSSLKAMRAGYYVPEADGGCPEEMMPDRLRCAGSYTWCIPNTAKRAEHE